MGAARGSYKVVAKSDDVTTEFVTEIRKIFRGCRPKSVHVRNFNTTLITSPYNEFLVFLKLERCHDREIGYFIQEHYIIIEKDNLFQQATTEHLNKPWFLLLNIPSIRQYQSFGILPNSISLSISGHIVTRLAKSINLLSNEDVTFLNLLRSSLQLLSTPPVAIILENNESLDTHFWCIALSLLLPAREMVNLRLFIGETLPENWDFNLGIVNKRSFRHDVNFVILNQPPSIPQKHDLQLPKFSSQLHRYLKFAKSEQSIKQLLSMIDKVKVDWQSPILEGVKNNLDLAIGVFAMSTIGLELAREEIKRRTYNPNDLQWIWRHMSPNSGTNFDVLTNDDWLAFFPILVKQNFANWSEGDFIAFDNVIQRLPKPEKLFSSFQGDDILSKFLTKWIEVSDFSEKGKQLFVYLAKEVASKHFPVAIELFFQYLKLCQNNNSNPFNILLELVQEQREPVSGTVLISLLFTYAYQIKNDRDLVQLTVIIQALKVKIEDIEQHKNLSEFLAKLSERGFSTVEQIEVYIRFLVQTEQEGGFSTPHAVFALFHIAIMIRNSELFEGLTNIVYAELSQPLSIPTGKRLEGEWLTTAQIWVFEKTSNENLFAAYIYMLIRLNSGREAKKNQHKTTSPCPRFFQTHS